MAKEDDRALRLYHEVLGLNHLHYGIWLNSDELDLKKLKRAQQRYEDFLIHHLPRKAVHILDVGCGTSALVERLLKEGRSAEGLSPCVHQKKVFKGKLKAPFHHSRFEEFNPKREYDCLIMSESAQYIPYQHLFANAARCLKSGGTLIVCDYFLLNGATGVWKRSGHNMEKFMAEASKRGFRLVKQEDLTDRVLKTMDLAKLCIDRMLVAADILTARFRAQYPLVMRFLMWLMKGKIHKWDEKRQLMDSTQFAQNKRYVFLLFKREHA